MKPARLGLGCLSAVSLFSLAACAENDGGGDAPTSVPSAEAPAAAEGTEASLGSAAFKLAPDVFDHVAAAETANASHPVLVVLDEAAIAEAFAPQNAARLVVQSVESRSSMYAAALDELREPLADSAVTFRRTFRYSPVALVDVGSRAALAALVHEPRVLRIVEDEEMHTQLADSLPLIHQPAALAEGKDGAGTSVAVLDTGTDFTRAAFGSCTVAGAAGCKVAFAKDFATEDGSRDANGHGTNVAGIVLGVAPGAKILALDVFDGAYASSSKILAAIDWVIQNRATYNTVAMNLSLGGGLSASTCGSSVYATAFANARAAGIAPVVASGNNASKTAVAEPACVPTAVSVGAVYDANVSGLRYSMCTDATTAADKITCFSNSYAALTLLAPGAPIDAAGYRMTGTSQAAPHVAGAVAVLRGAFPAESLDQTLARLTSTGSPIKEPGSGLSTPRIDLGAAAAGCFVDVSPKTIAVGPDAGTFAVAVNAGAGCAWSATPAADWLAPGAAGAGPATYTVSYGSSPSAARIGQIQVGGKTITVSQSADKTGPTGAVDVAGALVVTASRIVPLVLSASDPRGVTQMCLSNSTSCTAWESFAAQKTWTLASSGAMTVRAWYKDSLGNIGGPYSRSILVDTTPPSNGVVTVAPQDAAVALAWRGFADPGAGIASYKVVYGSAAPATCNAGTVAATGLPSSSLGTRVTGLVNGTTTFFRVCAVDAVGNVSTGVVVSGLPRPESVAPVGSVYFTGRPAFTRAASLLLSIAATDPSGVSGMCVAATAACTRWEPFAASRSYALSEGVNTAYVSFKDTWSNVSLPVTAQVTKDTTPPSIGLLSATAESGGAYLLLSGVRDLTGVTAYKITHGLSLPLPSCTGNDVVAALDGVTCSANQTCASVAVHHVTAPGSHYYRACATDGLGNVSAGAIRSVLVK